jgi:DNA repair exonuclease SbcCD ATPase subunit
LRLVNFKKVEDDTMVFGKGLTALRGANESSKSTRFQAIVYAFFGARALPLTLAETVTYNKPEASLRVEMDFIFEGSTYKIVRSKSGAVISNGTVTANGQAEVTKFVEKLFGINADAATKLMIASQNGLRGALESGEAVPLIERLANIDLIDSLINKIQAQLPCGNTANVVAAIDDLSKLEKPVLDVSDLEPVLEFANSALSLEELDLAALIASDDVDEGYHTTAIARVVVAEQQRATLESALKQAKKDLQIVPVKPAISAHSLREKQKIANANIEKLGAYKQFLKLEQFAQSREGDYDTLWAVNTKGMEACRKQLSDTREQIATHKAMLITETACGLCGKDLSDVPEVVFKNAKHTEAIAELQVSESRDKQVLEGFKAVQDELNMLRKIDLSVRSLYARLGSYMRIDSRHLPARVTWIAGVIPDDLDVTDYSNQIKQAEHLKSSYDKSMAVHLNLADRCADIERELETCRVDYSIKQVSEAALLSKRELGKKITSKQALVYSTRVAAQEARHKLEQVIYRYETMLDAYTKSLASKTILEQSLLFMQKNNALIKKLREARPVVASRLWAIVLASVSTYFSQIRGEVTSVTRTANSFQANGRAVAGLSGSTLDALGLAIRMALGKTFLPSVGFLLLDEPSAGMDDTREAAMLGLLSTVSYDQVVVVTHSQLCDSFATTVVQL